ncbi:LPS-assembly protein LptD [Phenylobacterium deserti]|nr:LPS assembly protein LptD [Phenylobacterium deserti]
MSSGRRTPSAAAKRAMLAGTAIAVLWSAVAQAQTSTPAPAQAPAANGPLATAPAARTPDGLAAGELYMEADQIIRDDETQRTTAEGSVEIRYEGRTLRADRLIYEQAEQEGQGVIRAIGNVQIINSDGTVEYANEFVLDEDMRAGVALGFSARLQENVKIAGASAIRRSENVQELHQAIYTPCPICTTNGSPKTPTWSISADRVVQDRKRRIVYYRNAKVHVLGAPVLYSPVFWHADPQSGRASGFLTPEPGLSNRRGFSYEQPYLWVISPYSDLVISPQLNTKVNPLLNGQYRQRFYSGDLDVRFGYTHERDFNGQGERVPGSEATSRSYILSRGAFQAGEHWRWGFTAERASDKLIFDKYDIGNVFESRGPYVADDRRLISQLYAIRQDEKSYFSTAAISIQGLRPSTIEYPKLENDRAFPLIAPLVESRYELGQMFGGRVRLRGSAVGLTREQAPNTIERIPGIDSRRVTAQADWRRALTSVGGLRVDPFVDVRVDGYSLSDVVAGPGSATTSRTTSRLLGAAGADISYPLFRRWRDSTIVLEPLAQVVVSPDARQIVVGRDADGQPIYLNEDSVAFEFDETTLFRPDKFPGFDLYEDGARLNVAGRASVLWDDGRRASLLVGRSFRADKNEVFSPRSGLRSKASDWVVAGEARPVRGLSFFTRARLDSDDLSIQRLEAGANVVNRRGSGFVRYLTDNYNVSLADLGNSSNLNRENLDIGGELNLTRNWGVTAYGNVDLNPPSVPGLENSSAAWVIRDVGVFYRDDCVRVDVIYRKEDTRIAQLGPREQITVRLTLATLGGPLYGR